MIYNPEQCLSFVEDALDKLFFGKKAPAGLYEPIDYVMAAGGKRVRPVLTLLACNLFSEHIEQALMPAVAFEVFHNFTLLHDDVMDKADIRRNRPTVHIRWSENTAILSGDAMMILAYQYLCKADPGILPELLDVFSQSALEVCEGQQYDVDFEQRRDVSIHEYMNMIRLKTAVLLAASLKAGAICGRAGKENAEALYQFGILLGLTFQIQDDWLDVYSDPEKFGKATGGDILTGKKTFMLLTALEKSDDSTRRRLIETIKDREISASDKIRQVKTIYDDLDISTIAKEKMDSYYEQAVSYLDQIQLPDIKRKEVLRNFAASLLKREK